MKYQSAVFILLSLLAMPVLAVNDFGMGDRYSVHMSFGASNRGKTNAPVPMGLIFPSYPEEMMRAGLVGTVLVGYTVGSDGSVSDIAIVDSKLAEFSKSVVATVKLWRFHPAIDLTSNKPVEGKMRCLVEFRKEEDPEANSERSVSRSRHRDAG